MNDPRQIWRALKQRSEDALSDEFWQDIASLMPNHGPKADLYTKDNYFIAVVELPGLSSEEQVRLSISGKNLHIRGDIPCPYEAEEKLLSERFTGQFQRKIVLPQEVLPYSIQARYHNGLLYVNMEKKPDEGEWPIKVNYSPEDTGG